MCRNVQIVEAVEENAVALAVRHTGAIPESIAIFATVIDCAPNRHAIGIDRVAAVFFQIELANDAVEVVAVVDFGLAGRSFAFLSCNCAVVFFFVGVINITVAVACSDETEQLIGALRRAKPQTMRAR